jgi:hypothetical protein
VNDNAVYCMTDGFGLSYLYVWLLVSLIESDKSRNYSNFGWY